MLSNGSSGLMLPPSPPVFDSNQSGSHMQRFASGRGSSADSAITDVSSPPSSPEYQLHPAPQSSLERPQSALKIASSGGGSDTSTLLRKAKVDSVCLRSSAICEATELYFPS